METWGFPLWQGVEMSLGEGTRQRVLGAGGRGGGRGVEEFVAMKDVGALGGVRTSFLAGSLGHVSPETERSLGSDSVGRWELSILDLEGI